MPNTESSASLPNVQAATSGLVHKAKMVRPMGFRYEVPMPACMSLRQAERMRVTGLDTDAPVTCTKAKCQG